MNLYFVYTQFVNDLNFERAQKENKDAHRLYKFGIAFSSEEKYPILGLFDLLGGGVDVTFGKGYFGIGLPKEMCNNFNGVPKIRGRHACYNFRKVQIHYII